MKRAKDDGNISTRRQTGKSKTRARVLREAASAVRRGGSASVAMVDVMANAGLTHGGFYAHFASRDDLVRHSLVQMLEEPRRIIDAKTNGLAPREALKAFVSYYLCAAHHASVDAVCALPVLAAEMPYQQESIRRSFAVTVTHLTDAIATRLAELGHPDPRMTAYSALAEMMGAISIARALPDVAEADKVVAGSRRSVLRRLGVIPTGRPSQALYKPA